MVFVVIGLSYDGVGMLVAAVVGASATGSAAGSWLSSSWCGGFSVMVLSSLWVGGAAARSVVVVVVWCVSWFSVSKSAVVDDA